MTERTRVVGYVRVSTVEQAEQGVSLAAQRAKIEQYCSLFDLELVGFEEDAGASAKNMKRPGLRCALSALTSGKADAIVILKLDRLTRSLRDFCELIDTYFGEKPGYGLLAVNDQIDTRSASGRLVLNILVSVSQWEREMNAERTKEAFHYKRERGERISKHIPYGYQLSANGRDLREHPGEQAVLSEARKLRSAGMSLRRIAAALTEMGFASRSGKPFAAKQIMKMTRDKVA